uniref:EGF-like domain-containing protein n=1 Tax=Magallana gigas TaxID=29159 RepID=A0A8W8NPW1_MAGGI|nr:uncharacterized protein LOC105322112 [Crassostrea gigas]
MFSPTPAKCVLLAVMVSLCKAFSFLQENGAHVCKETWYEKEKYHRSCSFWKWGRCTTYRKVSKHRLFCCSGYDYFYDSLHECRYAICDGKTNPYGACTLRYTNDRILKRDGSVHTVSGGTCSSPDRCTGCNDGFYSTGPYCEICPKIDHCNHRRCTSTSDNICEFCDGEVLAKPFWRAYTPAPSSKKLCQKACSWRSDSTRCYPGTCSNELASQCTCTKGFTGTHCQTMTEKANILENECKLKDSAGRVLTNPSDPNTASPQPTIWTNNVIWHEADTKWDAKYTLTETPPAPDPSGVNHYVTDFKYGIVHATTKLVLERNSATVGQILYTCPGVSERSPKTSGFICRETLTLSALPVPFQHNDKMTFTIKANIGGYLKLMNRENNNNIEYHSLTQSVHEREYLYHWDLVNPYHCVGVSPAGSCPQFLTVVDLTENPVIAMTWDGWTDALAGLLRYEYEVYELGHDGSTLGENQGKMVKSPTTIELTATSASVTLPNPGMFAIHFTAYDKAGNHKTSRKVILYDDQSVITQKPNKVTRVVTASSETSYVWVVQDTGTIVVRWTDRFINVRHENNRWLNKVNSHIAVEDKYDDHYGERQISEINNVHAIVDFKVAYIVYDSNGAQDSQALKSVSDIHDQAQTLSVIWVDGNKLVATVKAIDVLGKTLEEEVTVYRDATPPVIEDLWLTRGDRLNVSVHRLEDFAEMTVEWIVYDYHSGLDRISWRLYDNYTGTELLHGHEDIPAQGEAANEAECQSKYGSYARGANCYVTPFWGAYHKHFQVKPAIKVQGGLKVGMDKGVHDSDYYLEVSATSKAELTTILSKKITIDTSPPHPGMVKDGVRGTEEVDFQQSKTLTAHWDGFFDRESGVLFYQYGFNTSPIPASAFALDTGNSMLHETYSVHATHTVTSEGTYYICVVAYNRALEPSEPVCSDGVTVTTAVPSVQEVDIEGATVIGGLVTDENKSNVWIVTKNRYRRLIRNVTADCLTKATVINTTDLLPAEHKADGSFVEVNGSVFCPNSTGAPSSLSPVLSKSSMVFISWKAVDNPGSVHDYEVGFSSTPGSPAPDIMAFRSTKQHPHLNILHTDIPDGTEFYVIIKTISKANVEGIQSIGPCFMDTTPPDFSGSISVTHSNGTIIARWNSGAFSDPQEPYQLQLEFAIGHSPRGTQVQSYIPLRSGQTCVVGTPPTCTAMGVSDTEWRLHGHHTYYVTVKAENSAGLTSYAVSDPYIHDVQTAARGVVIDIPTSSNMDQLPLTDIEDIDFTQRKTSMSARWGGFDHPHLDVTYIFQAGSTPGASDIVSPKNMGKALVHSETGLSLVSFQTYYITITAVTLAGNVEVTTDGVTVVQENAVLSGIVINDGQNCTMTVDNGTLFKHHFEDNRMQCAVDVDFQSSTNSLRAYWEVPLPIAHYTPDVHFSIEEKSPVGNVWATFREYEHVHKHHEAYVTDLTLNPGRMYRFAVKFCAITTCYAPLYSDGVLILAHPPTKGQITVEHRNSSQSNSLKETISVTMDEFYDPDIQDSTEKYSVVDKYEWAITDQSDVGRTHTIWNKVLNPQISQNKMQFDVELTGEFDFSKCRRFTVRGYNKAKLFSVISTDIKDCTAFDPILIKPNLVIDAVGQPEESKDGYGKPVFLRENEIWPEADKDYTPNMNYISAVWPQLRYSSYVVAVLNARSLDVTTYYLPTTNLSLPDPCSHPDAIKCGSTTSEFININFDPGELVHGERYMVCIHTVYTEIKHEMWTQVLPELNICSDGIMVDLTPPTPGQVWIGNVQGTNFQTSTTDMSINWETFQDIEEFQTNSHSSGIQDYILGIGTSIGGNDMVAFFSVGVVNHITLHDLKLQSGHIYYATIKAVDFAGRTTVKVSDPVIVDTSPPVKTDLSVTITGRHIVSSAEIEACWKGVFYDPESEIDHFMWAIGSQPGYDDIMAFTREESDCGENSRNNPLSLMEGHAYYISVKAINKAGLMSLATSWAYNVDNSPPIAGHVYDGLPLSGNQSDIDFQTDMSALNVYWEGFFDPHSAIKEYYVSVGNCPGCDNVISTQALGMVNSLRIDHIHFGAGLKYFTTLRACNTADLCTTVATDGVVMDNSPPTTGVVTDGTGAQDIEYQSLRHFMGAKWYGFVDPQSGLDRYVWWAGTTKGGSEVLAPREIHLTEVATAVNFTSELPLNKRIYITVRAYNKAGLFTDSTSSGFIVDITAPEITEGPKFSTDFGILGNAQFYRTVMKVEWKVKDTESSIQRQYLSLKSHRGGEFDLASTKVNGIVRDFILSELKLHDGGTYYVTLISCNGAQICSSATSPGILVDSTPPNRGMFAIHTDHAAELPRRVSGWMTWSSYVIRLAWLGFADSHSDITHYFVNVGTTYLGADLNKKSGIALRVDHSTSGEDRYDEGKVQTYEIETSKLDPSMTYIYISMWAVNKAGLSSAIIHSKFEKVPGGALSLVRRCQAETCEGHCVCAPQDKLCPSPAANCSDISVGNTNNLLQVRDTQYGTTDINFTPSNVVLQGYWTIVHTQGNPPKWYQWSVGYLSGATPLGVFNGVTERVWHDAGQRTDIVFTTKPGVFLQNDVEYAIFIRVWYDENTHAIFKSDGVRINTMKPATTKIRGSAVRERMMGSWIKDQDYLKRGFPFTVEWTNKYLEAEKFIKSFHVYLSTAPGGHDVWDSTLDQPGSATSFDITRATLVEGVTFYSNIVAYGYSGLHHTETSDGFKMDASTPSTGMVYDGTEIEDLEFQNSSIQMSAHWHGFSDVGSGVKQYYWCVGNTNSVDSKQELTECSVRPWEAVGLHISVSGNLSEALTDGRIYYNKVYALDNVGYKSPVMVSDGVAIDTSPPQPQYLFHNSSNLLLNPSFETSPNEVMMDAVNTTDICNETMNHHPVNWTLSSSGCAAVVTSINNLARDGRSFLFVRGSVTQTLANLVEGGLYRLVFFTSHLLISSSTQSNKEGFAKFGNKSHVFFIYTKAYRGDGHGKSESREIISWHKHTFYFIAQGTTTELTLGSVDEKTGIFLDHVTFEHVQRDVNGSSELYVQAHVVYLHEWGSIHGSWSFVEDVSPITEYFWAIGYTQGGTQLQGFESVGLSNFAFNSKVTLVHNSFIYVTALATNAAGLQGIAYSSKILVDLTPPHFVGVYDGRLRQEDQNAWTDSEVAVNWVVSDPESGLARCEWALGTQPNQVDIQAFENVPVSDYLAFRDFDYSVLQGKTIYSTLRCENNAGLLSSMSSNGVKISHDAPVVTNAVVESMALSVTEYKARTNYQSVTDRIRLKWTGFSDHIGIQQYKVLMQGSSFDLTEKMSFPDSQDFLFTSVNNLTLTLGSINVSTQAINDLLLVSDKVRSDITVFTEKPVKHATQKMTITWSADKKEFTVSWDGMFSSPHPLFFELSAGKVQGGAEIIQWQETTQTSITFALPPAITSWSGLKVYVMVRAIAAGGLYEDAAGVITLPL